MAVFLSEDARHVGVLFVHPEEGDVLSLHLLGHHELFIDEPSADTRWVVPAHSPEELIGVQVLAALVQEQYAEGRLPYGLDARSAAFGLDGRLHHQDGAGLSLVGTATLDWCRVAWGVDADRRRLRPNLVVETTEPFEEETWVGRRVRVGSAVIEVTEPAPRCRTIDLAQDGLEVGSAWLGKLMDERAGCLAVYADIVTPGRVAVGDAVELQAAEDGADSA